MIRKPIWIIIAILALVSLACGFTIDIPVEQVTAGPTQIMEIDIPQPDASVAVLNLTFGAGKLDIKSGDHNRFVVGTATYNIQELEPKIKIEGDEVSIESGELDIQGIPNFGDDIKNEWELLLGNMPMELSINAGGYEGDIDLSGLAIQNLEVTDGAADVVMRFSKPNQGRMNMLRYTTGASNVKLKDLANANFASMIFRGGAGDYTLDFSGELQRDAVVNVEAGISHVLIIVPENLSARVYFKGGLASIDVSGNWEQSGDQYILDGDGPTLTINVDMGAGNLVLRAE